MNYPPLPNETCFKNLKTSAAQELKCTVATAVKMTASTMPYLPTASTFSPAQAATSTAPMTSAVAYSALAPTYPNNAALYGNTLRPSEFIHIFVNSLSIYKQRHSIYTIYVSKFNNQIYLIKLSQLAFIHFKQCVRQTHSLF